MAEQSLKRILDIPLEVKVEMGRTKLLVNEIIQFGQGTVIELHKLAGEPLDMYVEGRLVARGELVVINENFGFRVTEIIKPEDRIKKLGL
ncbi:flagellar motor switch protein FliN [Desulfovibrio sp. JC022]|jgi:flagellar motor switch protein FliN/FliY|nr:flagellar motor switch protein FliN [Desulfovibrio sp. JC022]NDV26154.1 flagellar motor switch protein FliN [Desulfovibrio sp. JC010]